MQKKLLQLFSEIYNNNITPEQALEKVKFLPFQDISHTKIDTHREIRTNLQEVIFGRNKTFEELSDIVKTLTDKDEQVLITKIQKGKAQKLLKNFPNGNYHPKSKILIINEKKQVLKGNITILAAGTSDIPIAEEAYLTAKFFASNVELIVDVGVAGLHRLLEYKDKISNANIIIAVAGMEGALPSVVAGLFGKPVVAVPTSVGYGANFNGIAPLLTMLNSCAPGITVVNVDNGFGAGVYAHMINQMIAEN